MVQGYDVMEELYNAKTAAINFVHEVCKVRAKGNLEDFMGICVGVMNEYKVRHSLFKRLQSAESHLRSSVSCTQATMIQHVL